MPIINQRIDTFLGLNNMLNPSSAEYAEGMAYRSNRARLDEHGLWTAQQALVGISGAPALLASPHGSGSHYKNLAVDGVDKVVMMAVGTICDVGPNKKLYSTDGSGPVKNAGGNVSTFTPPTQSAITENNDGIASRAENGTYYYMVTFFDNIYKRESLPSNVLLGEVDGDTKDNITVASGSGATPDKRLRFYRTKRIGAADDMYSPVNRFYFLGELTSGTQYKDYLHDSEIADTEYEGRGSVPPSDIDCLASFNDRMLYFKDNILYWSSAGQPQEVAQKYTITLSDPNPDQTVRCVPKLSVGSYGEAKFEITELSGHKVKAAMPLFGKLYVWTDSMTGYIEATNRLEGYRFHLLHEGIGVTSDKVLALSPYGLFGADRQGMWLLTPNGRIKRLTDNRIDLSAGEDTTFRNLDFVNSFGCWVPALNEYWWGVSGQIIAYQANRDIFVGPYSYVVSGGCTVFTETGAHAYLTGAKTPSLTTKDGVVHYLELWMGQSAPTTIKERLMVEVVHSEVPNSSVTAKVYQNVITSETGATDSGDISYSESTGRIAPSGVGRFFKLNLTLPAAGAPVAMVNYRYTPVGWSDTEGR